MKLLKGIFSVIIIGCLVFVVLLALMFDADTVTLWSAIKQMLVFFGIGAVAFMCYISIDRAENSKEDWQQLLDNERKER